MKKLLLIILCIPFSLFAGSREVDMWSDFEKVVQPDPVLMLSQDGMYARYDADEAKLTDKITYTVWGKTWSTKWPWSIASEKMRKGIRECKKKYIPLTASGCGWYDYKIIRLSPSGNYIELHGMWWESGMWRMLDTKTGKIVLSNDNTIGKSMWTKDKKQFMWQTYPCENGGCSDLKWTFITENRNFPKYKKVNDISTNF